MKTLYYNPMELPLKVRLKAPVFGLDLEYDPSEGEYVSYLDELFRLAKTDSFEVVDVYLTSHNDAYTKKNKKEFEGMSVDGWISLKKVNNGGGYHEDAVLKINKEKDREKGFHKSGNLFILRKNKGKK